MKGITKVVLVLAVALLGDAALLRGEAPQFGASAQDGKPGRAPGYRNAWDDCGGAGASATERMRTIAAKIKGWAPPRPIVRNAADDCGAKRRRLALIASQVNAFEVVARDNENDVLEKPKAALIGADVSLLQTEKGELEKPAKAPGYHKDRKSVV